MSSGNQNTRSGPATFDDTVTVSGAAVFKSSITPSQTAGIIGTTTNNNVNAGGVGEYVEGVLASASATSVTTGTAKTLVSISLTAGDWDVWGIVAAVPDAPTVISLVLPSISLVDNTLGTGDFGYHNFYNPQIAGNGPKVPTPKSRLTLAATTTVYLISYVLFTVSTCTSYGRISARRRR